VGTYHCATPAGHIGTMRTAGARRGGTSASSVGSPRQYSTRAPRLRAAHTRAQFSAQLLGTDSWWAATVQAEPSRRQAALRQAEPPCSVDAPRTSSCAQKRVVRALAPPRVRAASRAVVPWPRLRGGAHAVHHARGCIAAAAAGRRESAYRATARQTPALGGPHQPLSPWTPPIGRAAGSFCALEG